MKTLQLDENNNLVFKNGQLVVITNEAKVIQCVKNRLLWFKGEWFLDRQGGTPYFEVIFAKPYNESRVVAAIRDVIATTDGVNKVLDLTVSDYDPVTRHLTLNFIADTIYGVIDSNNLTI